MTNKEIPAKEDFVSFRGYQVWYRIVGDRDGPGKLPLLCLHGGPGATHDYLEPLEAIATTGRLVAFYDQLGNGNSARPNEASLWTVVLFVEEVGYMRMPSDWTVHILGQMGRHADHGICLNAANRISQPDPCRLADQRTPMVRRTPLKPSGRRKTLSRMLQKTAFTLSGQRQFFVFTRESKKSCPLFRSETFNAKNLSRGDTG